MDRRSFLAAVTGAACAGALPARTGNAGEAGAAGAAGLDLALHNATFWTGDARHPFIDAVGIRAGRIDSLGSGRVRARATRATRWIDCRGGFGMPAFTDCHTHFLAGSLTLSQPDLLGARSRDEFAARVGAAAQARPGRWILGGTWDEQRMGGALPTRAWIDAVTPDTPVAVPRTDLHCLLLNGVALRLAGITAATRDPAGGEIVRDGRGEPTGILRDNAKGLVEKVIPELADAEVDEAIRAGIAHALSKGVAHVHNPEIHWKVFHSLRRLRARGETGVRFYAFVPIADWQQLARIVREEGRGDDWVRWGGVKALADGSLGSHTAAFHEPYTDAPGDRGIWIIEPDRLRELVAGADHDGLHVAVHAIGDRAIDSTLDVFAAVEAANGPRDRRFRMEHAQHIRPASIPRFARQRIVASMQPYHAIDDGRWAVRRIGPERLQGTYAFRSLIESGARVAFGSDWPVAPLDPMTGLAAAVYRETIDGLNPHGWLPGEKLAIDQVLAAYTGAAAHAGFMEDRTGRLGEGFHADIALFDTDLRKASASGLLGARVLATLVGGEIRYGEL